MRGTFFVEKALQLDVFPCRLKRVEKIFSNFSTFSFSRYILNHPGKNVKGNSRNVKLKFLLHYDIGAFEELFASFVSEKNLIFHQTIKGTLITHKNSLC